jgi:hypothetical protein
VALQPLLQLVPGFLTHAECGEILTEIATRQEDLRRVDGRGGIGPRYSVLGNDIISTSLPLVSGIGRRLQALLEELSGSRVQPLEDRIRNARVQIYTLPEDGFRWHFDGHDYAGIVTLENHAGGTTEFVDPRLSSVMRPLFYPLYAVPQIFSVLPHKSIACDAGDALLFTGSRFLHRGRSRNAGRRTILVFAFDRAGRKRSMLRKRLARLVNY